MRALRLSLLVAACLSAPLAGAQGLGDQAAKEKATRASKDPAKQSRVFTSEDLVETKTAVPAALTSPGSGGGSTSAPTGGTAATPRASGGGLGGAAARTGGGHGAIGQVHAGVVVHD